MQAIQIVYADDLIFSPINVSHGLSDNQIRYIQQLPDGRMVFTTSGNVNIYDGARFTYIHRLPENIYTLSKYDGFYRIYQYRDSLLWIKDHYKLMCIDLHKEAYITDIENNFGNQYPDEAIEDFFVDTDQRIWLLTDKGLRLQDSLFYFNLSTDKGQLQDLDTENNRLYLFYNTGDVVCYDIETKERLYNKAAYPESEQDNFSYTSLIVKGKNGFYQLRNGKKGGFFFFDPEDQSWRKIFEKNYTLNTLIITPDEVAYISTPYGIWIFDMENNDQQYIPTLKTIDGDLIGTEISTLFYDRQGGLWVGTFNRGLLYYHPSRYKFNLVGRSYFTDLKPGEDIIIQAFAEDNTGCIYIRSHSGFYKYDPSVRNNKKLESLSLNVLPETVRSDLYRNTGRQVFRGQSYTALYTDVRGWVWAGTSDGLRLFRQDVRDDIFYTEDGLSNNFVHAILEDRNHNIWITTSYGISQIKIDSLTDRIHFVNFSIYDGTLKGEYSGGAIYEAEDGTLYFGGVDGFNILYPENISLPELPFKPVFTNLRLRGEIVRPEKEYDNRIILTEVAPYTRQIEFSYNQNFLTFEYSALNYQNQNQTYYRYQLEGIDSDWHETPVEFQGENPDTDGILRASYTNLPPGKYTLKVMASGSNRQWESGVSQLAVIIHPPWWKTNTAYCLYILFLIVVICGSVFFYIYTTKKKIERQHREEILLLRIRHLIEQCNQYETEQKYRLPENKTIAETLNMVSSETVNNNITDNAFLSRAIELVEKNLHVSNYSVEQLSRDLCMDRTGLYRKLITLLDKSPSLFIRNIRLQRAAQLILEGELSIVEITERVGFSSSSYLSKCFQEMYGCRPSEYAGKIKSNS